ncbi:hypothetical protein B6A42_21170 [Vibrio coralliilyticus]|nr:hypothetical protein B6A42_21170 [Vibrio coralliilyticus]
MVLKAYTEQRFQLANLARRRKLHSKHLLDVVGRSNKHRLLIHRWIEGDNLTYWYHGGERAVSRFYGCGQYIACFHRDSKPKRVSVKETGQFSRTLLKSSQGVAYLAPKLASRMEALCSELNTALKALSSPKTVIHGDFYAKQVLINQEAVRLIDFDDVCYWFPTYDLGLFIAHLERDELSGTLSTPALHAFRTAFIKGYVEELDYSANELELFTSVGLLELAHHPFRNGYPDWLTSISQLVERAEQHFQAYKWLTQLENFSNKLPLSSELCDPYYAEPLLRKVLPTLSSIERLSNVELVRYKPGKRALLDYSFQRADGARLDILGKVRLKGFDKRAWNVNSALYKANFGPSNGDGIQVPEPLGYSKCHHIWFQRKVVGQPCFALFCQSTNGEIPQRIAQALFKLHSSNIEIDRVHTHENEVELLGVYLTQAMTLLPNSADKIKDIIHCCSSLSTQWLIESPKVTIHRDFYHDQILINEPQIFLLDLDLFCVGDAALDVGNFVAHIEEQCLRTYGQSEYAYKQVNQFVNSYLEFAGVDLRRTIEIYSLLSWARHIFISQRIPARREWTEQIIHECERRILRLNEQKW